MQQNHEYGKAKRYMEGGWIRNSKLGKRLNLKSRGQKVADKIEAGKRVSTGSANKYQQMANLASANEQAKIGARTAQSKYNRLQGTGYQTALSVAKNTEEEAAIKDYETQIRNGDYSYNDGKTIYENIKGDDALGKALEYELGQEKPNTSKILALQNILSKTDNGRDQMVRAMNNALERGVVSSDAVKAFSSNIMANQGDYKGTHRSLYEYAKNTFIDGSTGIKIDESKGIQALTPSSFLGTDKTQMEKYIDFYKNGNNEISRIREEVKNGALGEEAANKQIEAIKSNPDRIRLEEIAHSIAYNPNVHSSIRKDDYGEALKLFADDINWDDVFSGRGANLRISHQKNGGEVQFNQSNSSTSTQAQPTPIQQTSRPESTQPTQAQPQPVLRQTSQPQPQQSQQSTSTQPQLVPQQTSRPQQQQKTDYMERLKEETIQRNLNGDISDEAAEQLLRLMGNSNNQNPNNS